MPLEEYRRKRHFSKTPEPSGGVKAKAKARRASAKALSFVVQKHDATRLHYDFRLELDGVLKSWAVPKGPSLDPHEKRLAVETEDHPLEYAKFEGTIPEGEYGAGDVIVWDRGRWLAKGDAREGLRRGKLEFALSGEKLSGEWVLVRLKRRGSETKNNWLLMKRQDDSAQPSSKYDVTESRPESVKSGRLIGEPKRPRARPRAKAKRNGKSGGAKRASGKSSSGKSALAEQIRAVTQARRGPLPTFVPPQLATLTSPAPRGQQWLHEIKFDGYRMLCRIENGGARLITRNELDWTHRYGSIAAAAGKLDVDSALLDGEVVALLESGVSSFQSLQNALKSGSEATLVYYVFDLLHLDGFDLRAAPLEERKELLAAVLESSESARIQLSGHYDDDGPALFERCCQMGLEGIISKRRDRPYRSGRSEEWLKIKCIASEELVIGGYTISTAENRGIGALLAGYFDRGRLVYAGRIGTGFDARTLLDLRQRLEAIRIEQSPFAEVPPKERGRLTRWVKPELVAQVEFTGWTDGGILRHPSFQGLREDKPAAAVSRPPSLSSSTATNGEPMKSTSKRKRSASPPQKVADDQAAAGIAAGLTHPERVLFPESGITKLGLATYYARVAPHMLPHLEGRPLSLVRCPQGHAAGKCFYQKHAAAGTPKALRRIDIQEKDGVEEYLIVDNVEGLLALAQMSVLEIHPWGSREDRLDQPDRLFFDLDPDEAVPWQQVIDAAIAVREALKEMGLTSFLKTTGGKGLHVVVPLSPRRADWDTAKQFTREVAEDFARRLPKLFTSVMSKAARRGKIFIDYLRNDRGSTAIAPFSTRAKPGAPVSVPLEWEELSPALRSNHFTIDNLPARLETLRRDPWKGFSEVKQGLPKRRSR